MLTLSELAALANEHAGDLNAKVREFAIGGRSFPFNSRPAIMGVINLSPDSWYRESVCLNTDAAVRRARAMQAQGAELIDVGAESTLAHAARLADEQQESLLMPLVRVLCREGFLVSVETYLANVARAALRVGAQILNLTGANEAETIYSLAADQGATVILCYVQGPHVREVGDFKLEADPIPAMREYFARQLEVATRCGLENIILDPGLGFYYRNLQDSAVRVRHQIKTFLNTFRLRTLGFPICHALPHAFEYFGDEVRTAEPFFAVLAALGKTDLFRTHEVPKVRAVLDTLRVFDRETQPRRSS
jgi:dihydropteroate synthase